MTTNTFADYKRHIRGLIVEYGRRGILRGANPVLFLEAKGIPPDQGGAMIHR